jgi:SAM-dependent methyltransferase
MVTPLPVDPALAGGNHYPKYTVRNPLARRLVDGFLAALAELAQRSGARQVHEIGCGEGFLSTMLAQRGFAVRGSDLSAAAVAIARDRAVDLGLPVSFRVADLYALTPEPDGAELVVCCEVLEHLGDPARALGVLARLARPNLIVSVPREPLWRVLNMARGRYWRRWATRPGICSTGRRAAFSRCSNARWRCARCARRCPGPWRFAAAAEPSRHAARHHCRIHGRSTRYPLLPFTLPIRTGMIHLTASIIGHSATGEKK